MLNKSLIDHVLFGPPVGMRYIQDSPVLPEVWTAYAMKPEKRVSLLITPYKGISGGKLALELRQFLQRKVKDTNDTDGGEEHILSYVENVVAVNLLFEELLTVVLPRTDWFTRHIDRLIQSNEQPLSAEIFVRSALAKILADPEPPWPCYAIPIDLARIITLAALICYDREKVDDWTEALNHASQIKPVIADATKKMSSLLPINYSTHSLIWLVSLNRPVFPAVSRSIRAIKADAATRLFEIDCSHITWAIVDSGIDATHPAFKNKKKDSSRVEEIYDFSQVRKILSLSHLHSAEQKSSLVRDLSAASGLKPKWVEKYLAQIQADINTGRLVDWKPVQRLLQRKQDIPPYGDHGTHVAGILAANWEGRSPEMVGVCPQIKLMDLRVLSSTLVELEFAVIAALQFIRYLNEQSGYMKVHGVNLSLQIPHDYRNYACGRTPVCEEANRLAANGVVVVAAAGNFGFQLSNSGDLSLGGYRTVTITDPGNAETVITVGATHRYRPHEYGVSFFSSRGPTGDGRIKPDLVAPGEKIEAPLPGGSYGLKDGTSMAAPHVSGAAAMMMARHPELIGKPREIKDIICKSATDLHREKYFQGAGMLDVLRALQSI